MFHLLFENFDQEHNSDQLVISVESKCQRSSAPSYTKRIAIFFWRVRRMGLFEILEVVITPLRIKVRNIRNYAVTTGVRSVIDNEGASLFEL